jgi:hypothetical protein
LARPIIAESFYRLCHRPDCFPCARHVCPAGLDCFFFAWHLRRVDTTSFFDVVHRASGKAATGGFAAARPGQADELRANSMATTMAQRVTRLDIITKYPVPGIHSGVMVLASSQLKADPADRSKILK